MQNVCFLLGGFQGGGGIGRATSVLVNELCKNKDKKMTAVSYCDMHKPLLYTISEDIDLKYLFDGNISMSKAILFNGAVNKLADILKKSKTDVVVACGALYYPIGILAAKKVGIKCFCWEHTNPETNSDYRFQSIARKIAVKKADKVIVLTKSAEKYYLDSLHIKKSKLVQIYNPVSPDAFVSDSYDFSSKKIISVGRLTYPKNFSLLIDIAADVFSLYPDWIWDIYGEGEDREMLTQKIESLGLAGKVNLKGQVDDLYDRYKDYSFQVMTSRYEGFPMSLIEGAANRLPLVSFDIATGPSEIIVDGKNGFLIKKDDAKKMTEKIQFLIEDSGTRLKMSEESFKKSKDYNIDSITEKWQILFTEEIK